MIKRCDRCKQKLPLLSVVPAVSFRSILKCRECGELWIVQISPIWRVIIALWVAVVFPISSYTAFLLWTWWPVIGSWIILFFLIYRALVDAVLTKRFSLG